MRQAQRHLERRGTDAHAALARVRRGETSTPYSNSAFVTTDMQTSLTGTDCRRLSTSGCERFMMYEHVSVSNM